MEGDTHIASERPTTEVVSDLVTTMSTLVARHVDLAKAEALVELRREVEMATLFSLAAVFAAGGVLLFIAAAVLGLGVVLPDWAAALIIGGGAFLVAAGLGVLGYTRRARRALPRMVREVKEDMRWLKPQPA